MNFRYALQLQRHNNPNTFNEMRVFNSFKFPPGKNVMANVNHRSREFAILLFLSSDERLKEALFCCREIKNVCKAESVSISTY